MDRISRTRLAVEGLSVLISDSVQPVSLAKWSQTTLGRPAAAFSSARASFGASAWERPNMATVLPAIFMKSRRVNPLPLLLSIAPPCGRAAATRSEDDKKLFYYLSITILK